MDRLGLGSLEVNGDSALITSLGDDLTNKRHMGPWSNKTVDISAHHGEALKGSSRIEYLPYIALCLMAHEMYGLDRKREVPPQQLHV